MKAKLSSENRIFWLWFTIIIVTATWLRTYGLHRDIWYDELSSLQVASSSDFVFATRNYDHPPFFFFLLRVLLKFSSDISVLRLFCALCSILTVAVGMLWIRLIDAKAAIIFGVLLACSPGLLSFSQELRPYSLLCLLTVFCLFSLEKYYLNPNSSYSHKQLLFPLSMILVISTHLIGVFLVPGLAIYFLFKTANIDRGAYFPNLSDLIKSLKRLWPTLLAALLTFCFYYFYYLIAKNHSYTNGWWMPRPSLILIASVLAELIGIPQFFEAAIIFPEKLHLILILLIFTNLGLSTFAITFCDFRKALPYVLLFLSMITTIAAYSCLGVSVFISRTLVFSIPILLSVIAISITTISKRKVLLLVLVNLTVFCTLASTKWIMIESSQERLPWNELKELLVSEQSEQSPGKLSLIAFPFDARDMIQYKLGNLSNFEFLQPDPLVCDNLISKTDLVYLWHYRKFMSDEDLDIHAQHLKLIDECGFNLSEIFNKQGIQAFRLNLKP